MRNKVLAAIDIYAEGGTLTAALAKVGLMRKDFYKAKREDSELSALYLEVQEARGDMMVDEAYFLSTGKDLDEKGSEVTLDPRAIRAMADVRLKIAAMFDRKRFGDKIAVELEAKPNLMAALQAGRDRISRLGRDLAQITDAQVIDITPLSLNRTADKQSGERTETPVLPAPIDPFED